MIVLGLNAFGHDAAAVLLIDGKVVFASSEERFDRRKHSSAFPEQAIQAALDKAGVRPSDVQHVAFPWTRGMARTRKILHLLKGLPRSLAFLREQPQSDLPGRLSYLRAMRGLPSRIRACGITARLERVPHHLAHAASARLVLPDARGAVLTADGMGEWTTAAAWDATGCALRQLRKAVYPHSAGKAYAAVTQWLGFRPESGEGKTMGLAAYGRADAPAARFTRLLLASDARRLFRVRIPCFGFPWGRNRLYGDAFEVALGPARQRNEALRPDDAHVARGIQDAVESVIVDAARRLVDETCAPALGVAGGLFLNCALNARLQRALDTPVFPFPVAGDAGAAWGAAAWTHTRITGRAPDPLRTLRLGYELAAGEASEAVCGRGAVPVDLANEVAARIAQGRLVGVARGRAEFGPRALGARSVLASPRLVEVRDRLNERKGREAWRPVAPVVLEDDTMLFDDLGPSPWMILTFDATREGMRLAPGGVHVDGSARVQTVTDRDDPFLADVIRALHRRGEPAAVLNTSFNRRGEPIVNTAAQAVAAAQAMELDDLVLADHMVEVSDL